MAIAALAASMFAGVGPLDCLIRGVIAFAVGVVATQLWYVFFTIRVQRGEAVESSETTRESASEPYAPSPQEN